jgi:hypothetical protein
MAKVLQFRIELLEIPKPIWRVIQVPARYTFWDLHVAIQDAMGWEDRHLHQFEVPAVDGSVRLFSFPDDDGLSPVPILIGWEHDVVDFMSTGSQADYRYDFGDDWRHRLHLERVLPAAAGVKYPTCTGGNIACPPEDCGGVEGYARLLKGDRELLEWLGLSKYRPPIFFPHAVRFSNPRKRWERAFGLE